MKSSPFTLGGSVILALVVISSACSPRVAQEKAPIPDQADEIKTEPLVMLRTIYPYSLISGGVSSREDFERHREAEGVLNAHYRGIGDVRVTQLPADRKMYASYRIDNAVFWTRQPVLVRSGETVLTDGTNLVRGRCGNRLSETPRKPVRQFQPPEVTRATPRVEITVVSPPTLPPSPPEGPRLPPLEQPLPPAVPPSGLPIPLPPPTPVDIPPLILFPPLPRSHAIASLLPVPRLVPVSSIRAPRRTRSPDEADTPEPYTRWLFLSGLVLLGTWRFLKAKGLDR